MPSAPSPHAAALLARFSARTARIGVVGLGYVGLPLALAFCDANFAVVGLDTDARKIECLRQGRSYIAHVGVDRVARAIEKRLHPTTDYDDLAPCDAIIICVPTPLTRDNTPDNSFIHQTARALVPRLHAGQLIVLESTTYPHTTRGELLPILQSSGLRTPQDIFVAYSPERQDPGNADYSLATTPKIVGGVNPESTEVAAALYQTIVADAVCVARAEVAEAAKLLENIYRSVNIALVNELKVAFAGMGIDVWDVIAAAKTKPFGFEAFYPGPGLGGHCLPIDPQFLAWKAAANQTPTRLIPLAGELNASMPAYVVEQVRVALAAANQPLQGARVLILGLSYKADIDDDRESPSYALLDLLARAGAVVAYADPYFAKTKRTRKYNFELQSVAIDADTFGGFDAIVVATAHKEFKQRGLFARARLVVDCRNLGAEIGDVPAGCRWVKA